MWSYIIDGILILIMLVCIITGIVKGFFDSVLNLVSSGLAIAAAIFLAKYVANFINKIFNFEDWILNKLDGGSTGNIKLFGDKVILSNVDVAKFTVWILSVIIVFLVIKLVLLILTKVFESVTSKNATVSGINRVLGMVFGIARGAVMVFACLAVCSLLSDVPVIGTPIHDKVHSATITGKIYDFVDDFVEKNITQETVNDIVNRIVSKNSSDDNSTTTPETEGGTTSGGNVVANQ